MNVSLLFYVVVASSLIMAAVWLFILAPLERRNHHRKLEMLQQKIKDHEDKLQAENAEPDAPAAQNNDED